jgi:hypothetical protein
MRWLVVMMLVIMGLVVVAILIMMRVMIVLGVQRWQRQLNVGICSIII